MCCTLITETAKERKKRFQKKRAFERVNDTSDLYFISFLFWENYFLMGVVEKERKILICVTRSHQCNV